MGSLLTKGNCWTVATALLLLAGCAREPKTTQPGRAAVTPGTTSTGTIKVEPVQPERVKTNDGKVLYRINCGAETEYVDMDPLLGGEVRR